MRLTSIHFKFLIFCLVTIISSTTMPVSAAELWSEDLWAEPDQVNQPQTICWSCNSNWESSEPTRGQESSSSTGSGLWSEDLWAPAPKVNQPAEQPKEDPKVPTVSETEPTPTEPGTGQQTATMEIIRMQIANHQAYVRGVAIELNVPPTIINDRTMVPLRFIGEALGAQLSWSQAEQKITMELNETHLQLWMKKATGTVNGQVVQLDTPPVVLNGSTLVPLKFISEQLGYEVAYDNVTKTVIISEKGTQHTEAQEEEAKKPKEELSPVPEEKTSPSKPEPTPPAGFNYIGAWQLLSLPSTGGMPMGSLSVNEDGTYFFNHGIYKGAIGLWRIGEKDEVIGHHEMLILENGPGEIDWVLIPKQEGMVSVRFQDGYTGQTKIWFEDSYGIKIEE